MRWSRLLMGILLVSLFIVAVAGCIDADSRGGGWIESTAGHKATFGIQVRLHDGEYQGQFQYHDRRAGVSFHGVLNEHRGILTYSGTYTPQPVTRGSGGTVEVYFGEGGEMRVSCHGGLYDGYYMDGILGGGMIKHWFQQ